MVYKPGKTNVADALSRMCQDDPDEPFDIKAENYVLSVIEAAVPVAIRLSEIQEYSQKDQDIKLVREGINSGNWENSVALYKVFEGELSSVGDILMRGSRIIIPQELRQRTLTLAHEGHPGMTVMKQRLRSKVWWPKIDSDVDRFVKICKGCLLVSAPSAPEPMCRRELPSEPWRHLALDFLGPLPSGHYVYICCSRLL